MIFQTTDSNLATRNGHTVTVVKAISEPDAYHDEEVLPMYRVRFPDGFETEVWDDELADR